MISDWSILVVNSLVMELFFSDFWFPKSLQASQSAAFPHCLNNGQITLGNRMCAVFNSLCLQSGSGGLSGGLEAMLRSLTACQWEGQRTVKFEGWELLYLKF
jgi:hypothetical protein